MGKGTIEGLRSPLLRAGEWFLASGIQDPSGGVSRYYRADKAQNEPVSTEITGYTASAYVYLHASTGDTRYLDAAVRASHFVTRKAWNPGLRMLPFEPGQPGLAYFFDCGIVVRGLLATWRATGADEFLQLANELGHAMARDFASHSNGFFPIVSLPEKRPLESEPERWSRSGGCYQLKSALAWWDLAEATGDDSFRKHYLHVLNDSLPTWQAFLPGHPERSKVMDRLHAFIYFLEGLLPFAGERYADILAGGIERVASYMEEIAPEFERSDVLAQFLRIRLYADWHGAVPLDAAAAAREASHLAEFQISSADPRLDGGFYFGRRQGAWVPHVSPVSTAFALQALGLWEQRGVGRLQPHRHLLI